MIKKTVLPLMLFSISNGFSQDFQDENKQKKDLQEITIKQSVGSRNTKRTVIDSPVAVDIINVQDVVNKTGQIEINSLLQYLAPSFNATTQSGSDGADHIVPATLRGLGPDQTLVLINGKRRHQSSLINLFGSRGRGNTGTDMNTIPAAAIKRIEILRDGASAQYGSDAIAGVINIVLKDNTDEFNGLISYGGFTANTPYSNDINSGGVDGKTLQMNGNYGFKIGNNSFINTTLDVSKKDHTNRPANADKYAIYRRQFGDAESKNAILFLNSNFEINNQSNLYFFGGFSYRDADAFAFTRFADSPRNIPAIYPDGFDPIIGSRIIDYSGSIGYKRKLGNWEMDLNNTYGSNKFNYDIHNTLNASLGINSPKQFDAGGHSNYQNTTGIHLTRNFSTFLKGLNIAFGSEFRIENFQIFSGEEASYKNYGINTPRGSQGFPGYSPKNEVNKNRTNFAAYIDTELDYNENINLAIAARYERYNDFGNTFNAKLAQRFKLSPTFAMRYSMSTGFRAPSLAQNYYTAQFTDFVSGKPEETLLASNNSDAAKLYGVSNLKQEKSFNISLGYTFKKGNFSATLDGYFVNISDRIVLSGKFDALQYPQFEVEKIQFFVNALDTQTLGADFVISYDKKIQKNTLGISFVGNINKMTTSKVKSDNLDKETIFKPRDKYFLLASAPESKFGLSLNHNYNKKINTNIRFTRFGEVNLIDWVDSVDYYGPKIVTDATLSYQFTKNLNLTVGANNLLNIYPNIQDTETETGGNFDSVQMGSNGRFIFAKLGIKI